MLLPIKYELKIKLVFTKVSSEVHDLVVLRYN